MTLQIVIPGVFSAQNLPDLGIVGFTDTFSRSNSSDLGYTEGRPRRRWELEATADASGGIRGGQAYFARTDQLGLVAAVADGRSADGTLEVTIGTHVTAAQMGLAFRTTTIDEMWRFMNIQGAYYRLSKMEDGSLVNVADSSGVTPAEGDRLRVVLDGPSIKCFVNGVQVAQATDSYNVTATRHGMIHNNTTENTFDDVLFTA